MMSRTFRRRKWLSMSDPGQSSRRNHCGYIGPMGSPSQDTAADKTLWVLEALADHSRIADIAAATGLRRPTVHRILQTLVERGFARTNGEGDYFGGPRVLSLAGRLLQRLDLPQQARPLLQELQTSTGWTVHLALLSGDEAVYAEKLEGHKPYHLASRVGTSLSLHSTSIGKSILSAMSDDAIRAILARTGMPARTPHTLTSEAALLDELAAVRSRGYAEDHEENEEGVCAVGAPVFEHTGQVVGAVSAAALVHLPANGPMNEHGPMVAATAKAVSEDLGAPLTRLAHSGST